MRILRIALRNLNSLKGEHVVDFEKPPLLGAGLFAIVGPTGAGKSTLLDAITLALYGRAARYGKTANPEDVMSRHCGECGAEVEFEAVEGRFRASWTLRRARGKASGALQAPKRHVYDHAGRVLAEKIDDASRLVERLIGLDYDRFLRSALLAQGEFARFLKAPADERALLLESLTGTDIYSRLGALAYAEATRREADLRRREEELAQMALLSQEDREARTLRIQGAAEAIGNLRGRLAGWNELLGRGLDLERRLAERAAVETQLELWRGKSDRAGARLECLARHELTEPFAAELSGWLDAEQQVVARRREQDDAALGLAAARAKLVIVSRGFGRFLAGLIERERTSLAAARATLEESEARAREAERWLQEHSTDERLDRVLPDLTGVLTRLKVSRDAEREGLEALGRASRAVEGLTNEVRAAIGRAEAAAAACALARQELARAETDVAAAKQGSTESEYAGEIERVRARGRLLETFEEQAEELKRRLLAIDADETRIRELRARLGATRERLDVVSRAFEDARLGLDAARDHLGKTKLVASLADHRSGLKPGEACPLCGALDHPFVDAAGVDPGMGLREVQEAFEAARKRHGAAEAALSKARHECGGFEAELLAAETRGASVKEEMRRLEERLREQSVVLGLPGMSAGVAGEARRVAEARVLELRARLDVIQAAEKRLAQARERAAREEAAVVAAAGDVQGKEIAVGRARDEAARLGERVEQLRLVSSGLETETAAGLVTFEEPVPAAGAEPELMGRLAKRRDAYRRRIEELNDLRGKKVRMLAEADLVAERLRVLEQRRMKATEDESGSRASMGAGFALSDRDTAAAERLSRTWATIESAEGALEAALRTEVAAEALAGDRARAVEAANALSAQRLETLRRVLEGSPFVGVDGLQAARMDQPSVAAAKRLRQELQGEGDGLRGSKDALDTAIQRLRSEGAPGGEGVVELRRRIEEAGGQRDALAGEMEKLRDELRRDDGVRAAQAERAAALVLDRARVRRWRQMRELIGSHEGQKFRKFAQGISLEVLLVRANRHLAQLSDRYRLRRHQAGEAETDLDLDLDLEVEIEDLHQAGALRPMASLSGGESFLASLAMALGLAELAGRNVRIDSLFIDEGFGTLDADSLDLAISALEALRQDNKMVGVISHVELLKERIGTQIAIVRHPGGVSTIETR